MALNKLLIVDDEESVAVTMQAILQLDGHDVEMCTRGDVALRRIGETTFDLVLTDLRLDDLDGLQIVAETHRRSPETIVIVLTGYGLRVVIEHGCLVLAAGVGQARRAGTFSRAT